MLIIKATTETIVGKSIKVSLNYVAGAHLYMCATRTCAIREPTGHRVICLACPDFLTVPHGGMSAAPALRNRAKPRGLQTLVSHPRGEPLRA